MADTNKKDKSFIPHATDRKRKKYCSSTTPENSLDEEPQYLDSLTEGSFILVASFLVARDLVMLERTNRKFGSKQAQDDQQG